MQKFSTLFYCVNRFQKNDFIPAFSNFEDELEQKRFDNEIGPSEESVKNILNFARSYDVIETKATGYVEMILN